jgi:hypothetical protein
VAAQLIFIAFSVLGLCAGLIALIAFLGRPHISRAAGRALAIVVGVSAMGFCAGFLGAGQPHTVLDSAAVIACLLIILAAAIIVARITRSGWGSVFAGMLLAGTFIAAVLGDYSAHAAGWHGQSLDVPPSDDRSRWGAALLWIILFTPGIFGAGVVVGIIARLFVRRRPAPSA